MTSRPDVSVVITNFNTGVLLEECLRSLFEDLAHSQLSSEVIVVDDGSTDGSAERVASRFPDVHLLRCPTNQGYAKANNVGIRAATGVALLLLNSDTVVLPGAIAAMFAALDRRTNVVAVGGKLLNPDGTVQRSCWRFPLRSLVANTLLLFRMGIWDDYRAWDHRADKEVDWISSAALMIRRSALDHVGLFDEQFFVYGVDVDWAMRARDKDYRFLSLAGAEILHRGGASWSGEYARMSQDGLRADGLLFRKHYGVLGLALYRITILLNSTLRVLFWGLPYLFGIKQLGPKIEQFKVLARWSVLGSPQNVTKRDR